MPLFDRSDFDGLLAVAGPGWTSALAWAIGWVVAGSIALMASIAFVENDRRVFRHFTTGQRCAVAWLLTVCAFWLVAPAIPFPNLQALTILLIHVALIQFAFKATFAKSLLWGGVEWAILVITYLAVGILWIILKPWLRLLPALAENISLVHPTKAYLLS